MNKPPPPTPQQEKLHQRRQDCRDAILARLDKGMATIRELDQLGFQIQEVSFALATLRDEGKIRKLQWNYERINL